MSSQLKKFIQIFACICIFSFIFFGLTINHHAISNVYAVDESLCTSTTGCFGGYINGFCNQCKGYQPARLTTGKYDLDGRVGYDAVYEISNAGQLYWFADKVMNENSSYGATNAVLTADIEVNKNVLVKDIDEKLVLNSDLVDDFLHWIPIGGIVGNPLNNSNNLMVSYNGNFDGQGHTISGLYFNDETVDYVGLFGLIGELNPRQKIQNVSVINSYFCGHEYVGGIVGFNSQTNIINKSFSDLNVIYANSKLGEIAGVNEGKITNCYNTSNLVASIEVGGISGALRTENGGIENSLNIGQVKGNNYVGSIVGSYDTGSKVANCHYLEETAYDGIIYQKGIGNQNSGVTTEDLADKLFEQTAETLRSGEVAYLLNNKTSTSRCVWGQNIDNDQAKDLHPVISDVIVYRNVDCDGVTFLNYSNTYQHKDHEYNANANLNKILAECKNCEKSFEIELKTPQNLIYDETSKTATISTRENISGLQIVYKGSLNSGHSYNSLTAPSSAGNYKAFVTFNDATAEVGFVIQKATAECPVIKEKIYNDREQIANIDTENNLFEVVENLGGINAGEYDVVLRLKNPANWKWENEDSDEIVLKFNIIQATNEWVIAPFIKNWNVGEEPVVQNGRPKFGQDVIVEYRPKDSSLESDYTTTKPQQVGEYFVRFKVEETANYSGLTYSRYIIVSESTDSGYVGSITTPTSRSPKNTPKGLPALAILGIVTLSVSAVFGIGIGIYHLVEKIKKDRKENKDKVK